MDGAVTGSKRSGRNRRTQGAQIELAPSWHEVDMADIEAEIRDAERQRAEIDAQKLKDFEGSWRQQVQTSAPDQKVTGQTEDIKDDVPLFQAHVGNLPFTATLKEIGAVFKDVKSIILARHQDGNPRGYANVIFNTKKGLQNAVALSKIATLNGRVLKIEEKNDTPAQDMRPQRPSNSFDRDTFGKGAPSNQAPQAFEQDWREQIGSAHQPNCDIFGGAALGRNDFSRNALGTCAQPNQNAEQSEDKSWSRKNFGSVETEEGDQSAQLESLSRDMFGKQQAETSAPRESIKRDFFGSARSDTNVPEKAETQNLNKKDKSDFMGVTVSPPTYDAKFTTHLKNEGSWRETKPIEQPNLPVPFKRFDNEGKLGVSQVKIRDERPTAQQIARQENAPVRDSSMTGSWRDSAPLTQPTAPQLHRNSESVTRSTNDSVTREMKYAPKVATHVQKREPIKNVRPDILSKDIEDKKTIDCSIKSGDVLLHSTDTAGVIPKKKDRDPFGWNTVGGSNRNSKDKKPQQEVTVPKPKIKVMVKSKNPFEALKI